MDFNDATALMRLVQAVENDPYVSSGAGEALADKVREFIEDEAELGGWYTELMNAIGELNRLSGSAEPSPTTASASMRRTARGRITS